MGRGGLEPPTHGFSVRCSDDVTPFNDNDLRSGDPTLVSNMCQTDPDFHLVASAWPGLPEAIRARILGLVEGAIEKRN